MGTSVIFITHDLGVVAHVADEVAVMKRGRIVETAPVRELFRVPYHPYTRKLLGATPHAAWDPRLAELSRTTADIEEFPAGYAIEERPAAGVEPVMHRFPGGRRLLLWPAMTEVRS
jgi:ABC-type dipeptide/oligopeptide/nickel transport system ATPase component